jgi:serine protease Do
VGVLQAYLPEEFREEDDMKISNWMTKGILQSALACAPALLSAQPPAPPAAPAPPATGEVFRAMSMAGSFLGVGVQEIDTERSKALRLKDEYGVEVTRVEEDSPAAKAGLRVNDVVLEFNGQRVDGTEQFVRLVRETPAGRNVKLIISRAGSTQTLLATIGSRKARTMGSLAPMEGMRIEIPRMEMMMPDIPKAMMSWRSGTLGVEAESLGESQLAGYFGVREGVLIRSVLKGTPAEKAGLKAGDVMIKVDESRVTSPRDVTSAIRSARSANKSTLPILVMRDKKEVPLSVTLEDEASERTPAPKTQRITNKNLPL